MFQTIAHHPLMMMASTATATAPTAMSVSKRMAHSMTARRILQQQHTRAEAAASRNVTATAYHSSRRMISSTTAPSASSGPMMTSRSLHARRQAHPLTFDTARGLLIPRQHLQQQQQRRSFYDGQHNFETTQLKPWEEIALDLAGWYVAFALLYPMAIRAGGEELDDGSWRNESTTSPKDDGDGGTTGKKESKILNVTTKMTAAANMKNFTQQDDHQSTENKHHRRRHHEGRKGDHQH
jgi:hypothetical protein